MEWHIFSGIELESEFAPPKQRFEERGRAVHRLSLLFLSKGPPVGMVIFPPLSGGNSPWPVPLCVGGLYSPLQEFAGGCFAGGE